jgi:hypothetical protein
MTSTPSMTACHNGDSAILMDARKETVLHDILAAPEASFGKDYALIPIEDKSAKDVSDSLGHAHLVHMRVWRTVRTPR